MGPAICIYPFLYTFVLYCNPLYLYWRIAPHHSTNQQYQKRTQPVLAAGFFMSTYSQAIHLLAGIGLVLLKTNFCKKPKNPV
jgi:hypothetical protein